MTGIELGIGIGVGIATIFGSGFAIGKARNGYVKQSSCDENISRITSFVREGQEKLHEKLNATRETVVEVKTILEERSE